MSVRVSNTALLALLALLSLVACGEDPASDARSPTRPPGATAGRVAAPDGTLRSSPALTLARMPRPAWPDDPETGLTVTLGGRLQVERISDSDWVLLVCGLPAWFGKDGQFAVRRSFARAGTYVVSAVARRSSLLGREGAEGGEVHAADCRITVASTPEETAHVRRLSAEVVGADGEVDEAKLRQLARTRDMRAVPALWRVVELHPNRPTPSRKLAVRALGSLVHLESVPRLIRLLRDGGVYEEVYTQLEALGLWGDRLLQWYQPAPTGEGDVTRVVERMLDRFAEVEPALRRALHQ